MTKTDNPKTEWNEVAPYRQKPFNEVSLSEKSGVIFRNWDPGARWKWRVATAGLLALVSVQLSLVTWHDGRALPVLLFALVAAAGTATLFLRFYDVSTLEITPEGLIVNQRQFFPRGIVRSFDFEQNTLSLTVIATIKRGRIPVLVRCREWNGPSLRERQEQANGIVTDWRRPFVGVSRIAILLAIGSRIALAAAPSVAIVLATPTAGRGPVLLSIIFAVVTASVLAWARWRSGVVPSPR